MKNKNDILIIKHKLLIIFLIISISALVIQISFFYLQKLNLINTEKIVTSVFRNEGIRFNPYQYSKDLSDLETIKLIKCIQLTSNKNKLIYLSTRFKQAKSNCRVSFIKLNGLKESKTYTTINGEKWTLEFQTVNSYLFFFSLWFFRFLVPFISLIIYFFFVRIKNQELNILNLKIEKEKQISSLSAQLAHDIRSPLTTLDTILKSNDSIPSDVRSLTESAVERIQEISNDLLDKRRSINNNTEVKEEAFVSVDIQETIGHIIEQKKLEYKLNSKLEIYFQQSIKHEAVIVKAKKSELYRIISNIINNSVESFDPTKGLIKIKIAVIKDQSNTYLTLEDNGKGMPEKVLSKIGQKGLTHGKEKGNGLGLSHAIKELENWGASLEIKSQQGVGTKVTLKFDLVFDESCKYILIDDDPLIRLTWKKSAKDKCIELIVFESVEKFLKNNKSINLNSQIYIDSNLNDGLRGEIEAKKIFDLGFKNIYLATGSEKDSIEKLLWIKEIRGKEPPWQSTS